MRDIIGKISVPDHTTHKYASCTAADVRELADCDTRDGITGSSRPVFIQPGNILLYETG